MEDLREVVLNLKEVREEKQLSYDQIIAMLEANGQFVSKSTLSRIFADGSEDDGNFLYETLHPIADVLLDIDNDEEDDNPDVLGMKRLLRLKKEIIAELKAELASQDEVTERRINEVKIQYGEKLQQEAEQFQRSIDFAKEQIRLKDHRIDQLLDSNDRLQKIIEQFMKRFMDED